MPTNISTNRLLDTMEWAKKMNFGRSSAIGDFLEPAKTSANIIKQTLLSPPFAWWWNTSEITFTCIPGQQDYVVNAPGFGWIENSAIQDIAPNPVKWFELETKLSLSQDSTQARPGFISPYAQNSATGDMTFRLMPVPDKAYPVSLHTENVAIPFTGVNDTWAPIPDYMSYIYNWGFLALMWMFADDPRWTMANQKFIAHLLGASDGLTESEKNIFLNIFNDYTGAQKIAQQQGFQGRGV